MKLIIKSWLAVGALTLTSLIAEAQEDAIQNFTNSQPIPPSPTAASLGLYGSYPVSTATGLPNINVPLYEVGGIGTSIPISLSYHGAGQKVTSVASWVGLGWSLNAGGTISRSVIGNEDDSGQGIKAFYRGGFDPEGFDEKSNTEDFEDFRDIAVRGWTADPDIYSFNFMEFSGQFYIDLDGEVRLFSHQDLEFERVPFPPSVPAIGGVERFIVKTGDGRVLEFAAREKTHTTSSNNCSDVESSDIFQSAWHLTRVTTQQDVFVLNYEPETIEYEVNRESSETRTALDVGGCVPYKKCESYQTMEIDVQQLKSITGPYGTAVFTSDKSRTGKDLRHGTALESIKYLDQTVRLNTIFSSTNRLKLDNVAILAGNHAKKWDFHYSSIDLPQSGSYQMDHYGYFNNARNPHLMPAITTHFPTGADREPNTKFNKAGQLLRVDYPTGGSTDFNWQTNKMPTNETEVEITSTHASVRKDFVNHEDETIQTFTINFAQDITVSYFVGQNGGSNTGTGSGGADGDEPDTADEQGDIDIEINPGFTINVNEEGSFTTGILEPGTYTFRTFNNGIPFNGLVVEFDYQNRVVTDIPGFNLMGGLRIGSIVNFNLGVEVSRKSYQYEEITESNFLSNSRYLSITAHCLVVLNKNKPIGVALPGPGGECNSVRRASSSNFAVSNSVSYSHVIEFDGFDRSENGRTEYFYNGSRDNGGGVFGTPRNDQSWKRALLEKKLVYDKDNKLLSKETFNYEFVLRHRFEGLHAGYSKFCSPTAPDINGGDQEFSVNFYDRKSEWAKLVDMTSEMFSDNGTFTKVTSFEYFHPEDHVLPNKIIKSSSRGEQEVTVVLYPEDFANDDLTIPVEMRTDFFRLPIEFVRFRGDQDRVTEGGINIYDPRGLVTQRYSLNTAIPLEGSTFLYSNQSSVASSQGHFAIPGDYELETSIEYAAGNRIREIRTRGGTKTFLWGYDNSYIVAEFDQTSFNDLVTLSGNISRLNSIADAQSTGEVRIELASLRAELPTSVFMKSYEYKNGIGLSRVVDVNGLAISYEYDDFGRLILVRDKEDNIIKHYSYEFK